MADQQEKTLSPEAELLILKYVSRILGLFLAATATVATGVGIFLFTQINDYASTVAEKTARSSTGAQLESYLKPMREGLVNILKTRAEAEILKEDLDLLRKEVSDADSLIGQARSVEVLAETFSRGVEHLSRSEAFTGSLAKIYPSVIKDIMVLDCGKDSPCECPKEWQKAATSGPGATDGDLNHNSTGSYIYLCLQYSPPRSP